MIVKKVVPTPLHPMFRMIRSRFELEAWHWNVSSAVRSIQQRSFELEFMIGELPRLRDIWRNDFAAMPDYLETMMRMAWAVDGPFLECGSGLSTILLGLIAEARDTEVWTLEHHPDWHRRMQRILMVTRSKSVRLRLVPLISHDSYSWYELPRDLPAGFGLVICDGPPGATPGGRRGLMPQARERLRSDAVVLLDDADREEEQEILVHWQSQYGCAYELLDTTRGTAIVRLSEMEPDDAKKVS